jgi:hypothetical protein
MIDVVETLILDLLGWVARGERSYDEVMDAWRTSCPKLPVWEDANDRGLITQEYLNGRCIVRVTPSGLTLLKHRRLHQEMKYNEATRSETTPLK